MDNAIPAGSKNGFEPEVRTRPARAVRKKRTKITSPRKASLFFLKSRQNSRHFDSLGAKGFSIVFLPEVPISV